MSRAFEELDRQPTPMGEISVRRRFHPTLQVDVWEVILGDEHLMSSLFTVAEVALGDLGLAALTDTDLDVVVGGLGLGYTARAVLADPRVRSLCVVEALGAVIDWHERDLLPDARLLTDDPRCHLVHGDFFAMVARGEAFGTAPALVDAILVDIDHTPSHVLDPSHAAFYTAEGLSRLAERLRPQGVFALWSDDSPDPDFVAVLGRVFAETDAHLVVFPNPLTGGEASNSVYVARTPRG
ncbi:MAG TPA: spermidine synthase [Acidimicrobiales bacterium]|nr:spermidine synthase [Acidimicrobiales bacterium]